MVRRIALVALMGVILSMGVPAKAEPPRVPDLLASLGGFAPAVLHVDPGDTVQWYALDVTHRFLTADSICSNGASVPLSCNFDLAPGGPGYIPIHQDAAPGRYAFNCGLH